MFMGASRCAIGAFRRASLAILAFPGPASVKTKGPHHGWSRMRIDHVIYGTDDLDAAAARFADELGLPIARGGRHDALGTHNRIVPLGDGSFIELLAVANREEAMVHRSAPRCVPRSREAMASSAGQSASKTSTRSPVVWGPRLQR